MKFANKTTVYVNSNPSFDKDTKHLAPFYTLYPTPRDIEYNRNLKYNCQIHYGPFTWNDVITFCKRRPNRHFVAYPRKSLAIKNVYYYEKFDNGDIRVIDKSTGQPVMNYYKEQNLISYITDRSKLKYMVRLMINNTYFPNADMSDVLATGMEEYSMDYFKILWKRNDKLRCEMVKAIVYNTNKVFGGNK